MTMSHSDSVKLSRLVVKGAKLSVKTRMVHIESENAFACEIIIHAEISDRYGFEGVEGETHGDFVAETVYIPGRDLEDETMLNNTSELHTAIFNARSVMHLLHMVQYEQKEKELKERQESALSSPIPVIPE